MESGPLAASQELPHQAPLPLQGKRTVPAVHRTSSNPEAGWGPRRIHGCVCLVDFFSRP